MERVNRERKQKALLSLSPSTLKAADELAARLQLSRSAVVRLAILRMASSADVA